MLEEVEELATRSDSLRRHYAPIRYAPIADLLAQRLPPRGAQGVDGSPVRIVIHPDYNPEDFYSWLALAVKLRVWDINRMWSLI
jgi:hypothetical protein